MADVSLDAWTVDWSSRVLDLPTQTNIGKVATPVIRRAEQLCDALDEAGEHRPDRYFLVSAILATTDADADDLAERLRRYRLMKVHQIVLDAEATEGEVTLPRPRP